MGKEIRNLLVNHIHDRYLTKYAKKYFNGMLIDIGCGNKPYKNLLAPYIAEHIGVDYSGTIHNKSNIDIFATAYNIPVEDNAYDSALCTAVLEHLEEPENALKECYRILKSGGIALYSMPFIWHLHEEPRDFYRYSKHGLKFLFEKVGFTVLEIQPLSGFWVTFGQMLVYYLYRFNKGPLRWFFIIDFFGLIIQSIVYVLDKIDKAEQWTWMYMVVAKKNNVT